MYQALYRKWRPKTFDDVVGQEHITETLKNQVRTGRLSHAYLFIGTRGTGKTTCAKILAKAVNCENPVNGNPCNRCAACRGIDDGSVLDVVEMDAASNNKVEDVRLLRDEAIYSPANVRKRVYIVDEVHMLSNSAFNALLKILEEPPEHLMFILATTELHKVPPTILSRCQRHSFKRIAPEAISARLRYIAGQEQIDLQPEAASLLARLADGGLRDALTLLDQCAGTERVTTQSVLSAMGLAGQLRTVELMDRILEGDTAGTLTQFRALWQDGKDPAAMLDELAALQRDALMRLLAPEGGTALLSGAYEDAALNDLGARLGAERILANLNLISDTLFAMAQSVDPKLSAELCLIRLCRPELQTDLASLAARVAALEAGTPRQSAPRPAPPAPAPKKTPEPAPVPEPRLPWHEPADAAPPWEERSSAPAEPPAAAEEILPPPAVTETISDPPPWDATMPEEEPAPPREAPSDAAPTVPEEEHLVPPPLPEEEAASEMPIEAEAPAPKPEAEPSAPPQDAAETPADELDWAQICRAVQPRMNPGQFSILRNPSMARGRLENGVLTVELEASLAWLMLNTPEVAQKLKEAARDCGAGDMQVKLRQMEAEKNTERRSLEELTRFGNVEVH